jgi:hypothetical protein
MSFVSKRAEDLLLGHERKIYNKSGGYYSGGGKKNYRKPKRGSGLKNITSAAAKKPEVMVKITSGSKSGKSLQNHLDYIGRNGKVSLETNDGQVLNGKSQAKTIRERWVNQDLIDNKGQHRQTLNLVLSMPAKTDPEKIQDAARQFAAHVFAEHEYVMALHTDTQHPHVHLSVTMQNVRGERMNPRKNDLFEWRVIFAEKMREQGIECAATRRAHRGRYQKGQNSTIENIVKRGGHSYVAHARKKELIEAIKNNKRPLHPYLKEQLETKNIMVSELSTLSRELYKQNMKTEARQVSRLAKELSQAYPVTKSQEHYDRKQEMEIER